MTYHDLFNAERPMPPGKETNMDSIPALLARVQAIEVRLDAIEGEREDDGRDEMRRLSDERDAALKCSAEWSSVFHEIGNILGSQPGEKYMDAARRVMRRIEGAEDAFNRVHAERNAAVRDRDEAVRTLHRMLGTEYGTRLVSPGDRTSVHDALRFLTRLGLAGEYEDGTFTLLEPKP